ncbi:MAG: methylenetetrahydrofolate dehydrogenase (NADP+) / methenyltetrahydrofolate cyclohydrolase [Parcubacteria group bacterium Gr01-1014_20]|nr:MAG: methylenetetrahydrofolate dehydrogenase (NADP+) / methenyltetrahydrofolate cyclohydrolase [Parcubacteria group bacterium Gr01-1014_20]
MIIDGKTIAAQIIQGLKSAAGDWKDKFMGAMLVGEDPASANFLKQKERVAKELGVSFRLYKAPLDVKTDDLRAEIGMLSRPKNCGGFLVQLPLPEQVNKHYVLNALPKEKDVDVLSEQALGAFYTGRGKIAPPAVETVTEILKSQIPNDKALRELKFILIGAGFLIGKPVGFWLQNRAGEVTIYDSSVKNFHPNLKEADVVVSGAGVPGLFSAKDLKEGSLVIDFGFNKVGEKICGDFNPGGADERNIAYTKTPGGTGPILVAKLYENFWKLNS